MIEALEMALERMQAERDETMVHLAVARAALRVELARFAAARAMLREHQWSDTGCPECGAWKGDGHKSICAWAKAMEG
jgi:hypothetical protein